MSEVVANIEKYCLNIEFRNDDKGRYWRVYNKQNIHLGCENKDLQEAIKGACILLELDNK